MTCDDCLDNDERILMVHCVGERLCEEIYAEFEVGDRSRESELNHLQRLVLWAVTEKEKRFIPKHYRWASRQKPALGTLTEAASMVLHDWKSPRCSGCLRYEGDGNSWWDPTKFPGIPDYAGAAPDPPEPYEMVECDGEWVELGGEGQPESDGWTHESRTAEDDRETDFPEPLAVERSWGWWAQLNAENAGSEFVAEKTASTFEWSAEAYNPEYPEYAARIQEQQYMATCAREAEEC